MRSCHRAELTNLVELYFLDTFKRYTHPHRPAIYRDNGLIISSHMDENAMDRFKKDSTKIFKEFDLSIKIVTNLTMVNFLDRTLDLNIGKYYLHRRPNKEIVFIHKSSIHSQL